MKKSIFLFPGQGSQYVGMGRDLYENFPIAKQVFEEAEDCLKMNLKKICFEGPESDLKRTYNTQPAILTMSVAIYKVLELEMGIEPSLLAGHSLGEYSALVVAKVLKFWDAVKLVRLRGQAMQQAVSDEKTAMAALMGIEAKDAQELCAEVTKKSGYVACANFNGGGQVVISGTKAGVDRCLELAPQKGIRRAILLEVSAPFHCHLMEPAAKKVSDALEGIFLSQIQIPYIANVDARIYEGDSAIVRNLLIQQIPNPVLWEASMKQLSSHGIEHAYEVGPGKVLCGLLRRIQKDIPTTSVQSLEDIRALAG